MTQPMVTAPIGAASGAQAAAPAEVGSEGAAGTRAALEATFERLLAEHGAALMRLAIGYTRSAGDAEDLRQDIALALWGALPRFRGDCSERTFLYRIAHNRALAWLTRARSRASLVDREADDAEVRDPRPNPEADLAAAQRGRRLLTAIRELPLPYRQVVMLALEELEYREIAQVLGLSESNVGVRLTRARQMLRRILERTA